MWLLGREERKYKKCGANKSRKQEIVEKMGPNGWAGKTAKGEKGHFQRINIQIICLQQADKGCERDNRFSSCISMVHPAWHPQAISQPTCFVGKSPLPLFLPCLVCLGPFHCVFMVPHFCHTHAKVFIIQKGRCCFSVASSELNSILLQAQG